MPSTARQLRQPPTIEAIGRVPYFADVGRGVLSRHCPDAYYLVLSYTVLYCLVLFPTIGWPTTSALAAATTIYIRYPLLPPSPLHTTM